MTIPFSRELPLRYDVDVLVAGGGPAGVTAAVAAARQGAQVLLVEAGGSLGGAAITALVPAFMPFDNGVDFMAGGIGREVYDAALAEGSVHNGNTVGIYPEGLKRVYDRMVQAEPNITLRFFTSLAAVQAVNGAVEHVMLLGKSGLFAARAKVYIDCTGDGDLCAWAGAGYDKGDAQGRMMPGTLCSAWAGIDWSRVQPDDGRRLEDAFRDGVFTVQDKHHSGMWRTGGALGGANVGHTFGVDGTDEVSLTAAMLQSRRALPEYHRYYTGYLQGFEAAEITASGAQIGIRETRRIRGLYVLDENDFQARATFEDEVGRFSYPVDIHASSSGEEDHQAFLEEYGHWRYGPGESYGIPYRSLVPMGFANLLMAGRCISTDRRMQSSVRVMPCCYITGQAAGIAAALACAQGVAVPAVDTAALRARLRAMGAWLPK